MKFHIENSQALNAQVITKTPALRRHWAVANLAIAAAVAAVLAPSARGTSIDWNPPVAGSGGSTTWATGTNWIGGSAPANDLTTDVVRFNKTSYNFQPNAGTTSVLGIEIGDGTTATAALTLSGVNLSIGANGITKFVNSGAATISSPITLGTAQQWANNSGTLLTVSGGITNGSNLLTIAGSGSTTLSGVLNGAGGIVKNGAGTLTVSGVNTSFSGGITINSGKVIQATSLSSLGTGTIVLGDATLGNSNSATLQHGVQGQTIANAITVAAGSSGTLRMTITSGNSGVYSGNIALNNNLTLGNLGATGGQQFSLNGVITGSSDIFVDSAGNPVLLGGNNAASWTGNIIVLNGQFWANNANAVPNIAYIGANGIFDIRNGNVSIKGLSDYAGAGGNVTEGSGSRTLTLKGNGAYLFSGNITKTSTSVMALTLASANGAGSQTLSGANTYDGLTTVSSGILNIRSDSALGSTANGTIVSGSGTLQLQGDINVGAEALTIGGTGAVGQNGAALVNVSGNNTYAGQLTWNSAATPSKISSESGNLALTNTNTIAITAARNVELTGAGNGSIAGGLSGAGSGLIKSGNGTWILSGNSTYTGATTINAGTLVVGVSGVDSLTSAIIATAGTLGGSGSTTGNVAIGNGTGGHDAFIAPGNSAGTFTTTGNLSLLSDATYLFELNGTTGVADKLLANAVTLDSNALFSFILLGDISGLSIGQSFTIIDQTGEGNITGSFNNLIAGGTFDAGSGLLFSVSGDNGIYGNDLDLTIVAIPEPSTTLTLLLGLGLTVFVTRRHRNGRLG